eukprot:scaffold1281_cov88-Cylindrotheca_fusiformis.AAC.2
MLLTVVTTSATSSLRLLCFAPREIRLDLSSAEFCLESSMNWIKRAFIDWSTSLSWLSVESSVMSWLLLSLVGLGVAATA